MRELIENACGILAIAIVLIAFSAFQSRIIVGQSTTAPSAVWASSHQPVTR
jgi:hypothetical protein